MNAWITPPRAAALSAGLAILVHVGALRNGFAYDDLILIVGDPGIRQLDGLGARLMQPSWPAAFGDEIGAWRPVTTGAWALVWALTGGGSVAFHAFGVLLHAAVTALGVLVFAELVPLFVALGAGLLFAVHPVHTEAVANVAGSAELISATFVMLAALVHLQAGRRYSTLRVAAVAGLYAAAVLAKEGAAVLPLLLFLLDGARRDVDIRAPLEYIRSRGGLLAALSVTLAGILLLRMDAVGAVAASSSPPGGEILREASRIWTVFTTWPHYVRLLFYPATLGADYGPGVIPVALHWSANAILGAMIGLVAFGGAALVWGRTTPLGATGAPTASGRIVPFSLLWIAAALLPVANVVYLGPVFVAERTLYLASWGAALIVAWLCVALSEERRWAGPVALSLVVLAGSARTVERVPDWSDTETIMQALIEDRPESGTAWMHLGRRLAAQGRPDDALTAFAYAVALLNSEYRPITEVSAHLLAMGRNDAARPLLRRAWAEHPEWYTAPGLLAAVELNAGRPADAVPAARAAIALQPGNASMHHLLAQALSSLERWEDAAVARRASIRWGFTDRGRSWLALSRDEWHAGRVDVASASLDSASVRTLTADEVEILAALRDSIATNARPGR